MRLGVLVDSYLGGTRLARDVPVVDWAWSEKAGVMPSGKWTMSVPALLWPVLPSDALAPWGQTLRAELHLDGAVTVLPPLRIMEAAPGKGVVEITAESRDLDVKEDPWPVPSSPRTGASLLQEATRLADPVRVRLAIPDEVLPDGIVWSGDRDEALLELARTRSARWEMDADGALVLRPLGSVSEPDRVYRAERVVASSRKASRKRVSKATVVAQASGGSAGDYVTKRLTGDAWAPERYGTVGVVETSTSGASREQLAAQADALLAEGGGEREFTILADPTLRAGMVVRVDIEDSLGREAFVGRVTSHSLARSGEHQITVREA